MDNNRRITCYHEAGHIIASATIGRCVSKCSIIDAEEGNIDYFSGNTSSPNTISEIIQSNKPLSCEEIEAEKLKYYRSQNLEDNLMTLAAGIEAALVYAREKGWDTEQINGEVNDQNTRDLQDMNAYIEAHGRQSERDKLIENARKDAKWVLGNKQIWEHVCKIAEFLVARGSFEWDSPNPLVELPKEHKQIIDNLINWCLD